jgi:putative PIN family toxin of toxin-antitoxin system
MLKLVLDANTLISGFFWEGNEAELIRKIERKDVLFFTNREILAEIREVIARSKFEKVMFNANLTADQIISKIISLSHIVVGPKLGIKVVKEDRSDNKFLECAVQAKVDYIVSGDKHLLNLREFQGIKIVKTKEVLSLL